MSGLRGGGAPMRAAAVAIVAIAASVVVLGGIGGCSLRDRSNPLDPMNRSTRGMLTGFNALAGDNVVSLVWTPVAQQGVESYRIDRWTPGQAPQPLPGALYAAHVASAEDLTARNDSTYLYRIVAHFASGDSAASPPDTATPGTRRIMVLVASLPGVAGLSPDARDVLYGDGASEPYDEIDLDSTRGIFWLSQVDRGVISSRLFESLSGRIEFQADHPTDIAVTTQRGGIVWAAEPELSRVVRFGTTDTLQRTITGFGATRFVESNSANVTLWIGSDDGLLVHAGIATDTLQTWSFSGRVGPIGVDEASDQAWVAVRSSDLFDLYLVTAGNPEPILLRSGLLNVTDIKVEGVTRTAWVSERGAPLAGNGRLTRFGSDGTVIATVSGIEPYALCVEPGSREVWVTDIRSDRLIEVSPGGAILRRSPALGVPYGVRVYRP